MTLLSNRSIDFDIHEALGEIDPQMKERIRLLLHDYFNQGYIYGLKYGWVEEQEASYKGVF